MQQYADILFTITLIDSFFLVVIIPVLFIVEESKREKEKPTYNKEVDYLLSYGLKNKLCQKN